MPISDALLGPPEFYNRFAGRFFGPIRALVKDNLDPQGKFRVRVTCPKLYGADLSPWAWPCLPGGGGVESGFLSAPPVDSLVYIICEEGLPSNPIWLGGFWTDAAAGRPSDGTPLESSLENQLVTNMAPAHTQGRPDGSDLDGSPKGLNEDVPQSSFQGTYPNIRMWKSPAGHFIEMDDTPGNERIQVFHKNGGHIEILPDGTTHVIATGNLRLYGRNRYDTTLGNELHKVKGSVTETVNKNYDATIGGAYKVNADGDLEFSGLTQTWNIRGNWTAAMAAVSLDVRNNWSMVAGGDADFGAFGSVKIASGNQMRIVASASQNIANPLMRALSLVGQNGRVLLQSVDRTGVGAKYGIEAQGYGAGQLPLPPMPGSLGPFVKLGNLGIPPTGNMVPLIDEPAVLGFQLYQYLLQLHAFLNSWLTDYIAHLHLPLLPSVTSPIMVNILPQQLQLLQTLYLTPLPPKMHPLIVSDVVFNSKT